MPTNVSPEYKQAEVEYRQAREPRERLECLQEMLRTIPKHKGTENLQADIKTRIKSLSEDLASPRKGGPARGGPPQVIRREGAAQIALVGPPNSGKSTLHACLTGSHAEVGPYPFTTQHPLPGMLPFEDILLQLVDLPPVSADYLPSWIGSALGPAHACLLVLDLADPECVDHVEAIRAGLQKKHVTLLEQWHDPALDAAGDEDVPDPFAVRIPTVLVANKIDLLDSPEEELEVFAELLGIRFPTLALSATTGQGIELVAPLLFDGLGVVRVYTKAPGREPDKKRPFTVKRGDTVHDVAMLVHRDVAGTLKYARCWGASTFDGQQVGRDHEVHDGDVLELHADAVNLQG